MFCWKKTLLVSYRDWFISFCGNCLFELKRLGHCGRQHLRQNALSKKLNPNLKEKFVPPPFLHIQLICLAGQVQGEDLRYWSSLKKDHGVPSSPVSWLSRSSRGRWWRGRWWGRELGRPPPTLVARLQSSTRFPQFGWCGPVRNTFGVKFRLYV